MDIIEVAKQLKKKILTLNEREDLTVTSFQINEPASAKDLEVKKGTLPEALLDFYTVMNGCEFSAFFSEDSHLNIGINIPSITEVGEFITDNVAFNFKPDIRFIAIEFIDPTGTTFFVLKKEDNIVNKATLVSCWAGQEYKNIKEYKSLADFIEKAILSDLTICWFSKQMRNASESVKRRLAKPAKRRSKFFVDARVQQKQLGLKGSIIRIATLDESVKNAHVWALVHFDQKDNPLWVPIHELNKRGKKLEPHDKIILAANDFLTYLMKCTAEETAMLLKDITNSRNDSYTGLKGLQILISSYSIYKIFKDMDFESFVEWSYSMIKQWAILSATGFYEKHSFKEKKGPFRITKNEYSFNYFEITYNLLGGIVIMLMENKYQNSNYKPSKKILDKLKLISESVKAISLGTNTYDIKREAHNYDNLLDILKYLTNENIQIENSPIYRGVKINEELSMKGLDNKFNSLFSI